MFSLKFVCFVGHLFIASDLVNSQGFAQVGLSACADLRIEIQVWRDIHFLPGSFMCVCVCVCVHARGCDCVCVLCYTVL